MIAMNYITLYIKKTLRFLLKPLSFVPALLVMLMIFSFSAQNGVQSSGLSLRVTEKIVHSVNYHLDKGWSPAQQEYYVHKCEFYVRKLAHFSEYLLLAVTLSIPLYVYGVRNVWLYLLTIILCFIYACTDEYHQSFVGGRSPQFRDVCIDTCGAAFGTLLVHPWLVLGRKTVFKPLSLEKERRMKEEYYRTHQKKSV